MVRKVFIAASSRIDWSGAIATGAVSIALSAVYWGFHKYEEAASRSFQELNEQMKESTAEIKRSNEMMSAKLAATTERNAARIDAVQARTDFAVDKAVKVRVLVLETMLRPDSCNRKNLPCLRLRTAPALPVSQVELRRRSARAGEGRNGLERVTLVKRTAYRRTCNQARVHVGFQVVHVCV